jgi:hypothetical protein
MEFCAGGSVSDIMNGKLDSDQFSQLYLPGTLLLGLMTIVFVLNVAQATALGENEICHIMYYSLAVC